MLTARTMDRKDWMNGPAAKSQTACSSNQKTGGGFPGKYQKPKTA